MKKILLSLAAFVFAVSLTNAQTVVSTTAGTKASAKATTAKTQKIKTADASTNATAAPDSVKKAPKMKKDGTPDKRFKENKAAKGPMKKDGTPDMRYKSNKMKGAAKDSTMKK